MQQLVLQQPGELLSRKPQRREYFHGSANLRLQ
jgi:hypothetical protein